MRTKYKVSLFKINLLIGALLLGYQAFSAPQLVDASILSIAALWLAITGLLIEFNHRRQAHRSWLPVISVLLTALIMLSPDAQGEWLWAWPCLLMLAQPTWMLALNIGLSCLCWWWLLNLLSLHHWLLSGAVLLCMILIAVARSLPIGQSQRTILKRARLAPGLPLWPLTQLERDLPREHGRAARDNVFAELVLIQTSARHLWPLAQQICHRIHAFENVYRVNSRTIGVILTSQDALQAESRRTEILESLAHPSTIRATALGKVTSLPQALSALDKQPPSTRVIEDTP
ncbi:hypothetical protein [Halomonas huangheensis]|uniref:GGDEF domain-containing protein n=1 Tax=Halomonas huangheensis TaxID=1178482 RepID=W1ND29_9GAMM|nr:hypothetical protein [Halomonas huangheensis]ALM52896.1 hypothetical protein AR456_11830 [Halomonas huangheensis]ERL53186.1 hypothetical protein BJB45_18095 [Halomonas huangheensis]